VKVFKFFFLNKYLFCALKVQFCRLVLTVDIYVCMITLCFQLFIAAVFLNNSQPNCLSSLRHDNLSANSGSNNNINETTARPALSQKQQPLAAFSFAKPQSLPIEFSAHGALLNASSQQHFSSHCHRVRSWWRPIKRLFNLAQNPSGSAERKDVCLTIWAVEQTQPRNDGPFYMWRVSLGEGHLCLKGHLISGLSSAYNGRQINLSRLRLSERPTDRPWWPQVQVDELFCASVINGGRLVLINHP